MLSHDISFSEKPNTSRPDSKERPPALTKIDSGGQRDTLRQIFQIFSKNKQEQNSGNEGSLSSIEFFKMAKTLNLYPKLVPLETIKKVVVQKDGGQFNFVEFVQALKSIAQHSNQETHTGSSHTGGDANENNQNSPHVALQYDNILAHLYQEFDKMDTSQRERIIESQRHEKRKQISTDHVVDHKTISNDTTRQKYPFAPKEAKLDLKINTFEERSNSLIAYDGQEVPDCNSNDEMNFMATKTVGMSCAQMQRHDSSEKNELLKQNKTCRTTNQMFVFDEGKSPKEEQMSATAFAKSKRKRGKKVIRPTFSNNPFQVYSIYFTRQNQQADKSLEMKLKPWERDYIASLNNKLRGSCQSVTVGDAASVQKIEDTIQELEKNQTSNQRFSNITKSQIRARPVNEEENLTITTRDRSLPPLRKASEGSTSRNPSDAQLKLFHKQGSTRRSQQEQSTVGTVQSNRGIRNQENEYASQNSSNLMSSKFVIKNMSHGMNDRYRNDYYKNHSNSIDYQAMTDGESIVKEEQESVKTYQHGQTNINHNKRIGALHQSIDRVADPGSIGIRSRGGRRYRTIVGQPQNYVQSPQRQSISPIGMNSVRYKTKKAESNPKNFNKSQMNLAHETDSTGGKKFSKLQKVQINQALLSNKAATSYAFDETRYPITSLNQQQKQKRQNGRQSNTRKTMSTSHYQIKFGNLLDKASPKRAFVGKSGARVSNQTYSPIDKQQESISTQNMEHSDVQTMKMSPDYTGKEAQNSKEMITNIELNKGQFKKVKPRYVEVDKTVDWNKNWPTQNRNYNQTPEESKQNQPGDEDTELCRMQSGLKKTTNATILRDHLNKIKKAFDKFQTQHALLLAKQAETSRHRNI